MVQAINLHPDRLFSSNAVERDISRRLYKLIKDLPIVSPHGHTDPKWFADNEAFSNATELLIQPDHYLVRMLYSQGVSMASLGFGDDCETKENDPKKIWQTFAKHYYLFQGTPTSLWLDYVFVNVFELTELLCEENADEYYAHINHCLQQPEFTPRALFERFNIEVIATTDAWYAVGVGAAWGPPPPPAPVILKPSMRDALIANLLAPVLLANTVIPAPCSVLRST